MKKNYPQSKCFVLFLSALLVTLSGCVDNDYDLTKKINTDMTIGAGLTIPLGQIKKQVLSDLVDLEDMNELEEDENGGYRFRIKDQISEEFELGSVPNFQVDMPGFLFGNTVTMPELSTLSVPSVNIEAGTSLPPIPGSGMAGIPIPTTTINYPADGDYEEYNFKVGYFIPDEINKIESVVFQNTIVSIDLDKSGILSLIDASAENFAMSIEFPEQFVLESMNASNVSINGNKVTINDLTTDIARKKYQFKLSKLVPKATDASEGNLDISEFIKYKFSYTIAGKTKAASGTPNINVVIAFVPQVDEVIATTNPIAIDFTDQEIALAGRIELPKEVTSVSEVLFAQDATIDLTIKNTGSELPMQFGSNGNVQLKFPLAFMFNAHTGLVKGADAWTLDVPASKLFERRVLSFSGINLSGLSVVDGAVDFSTEKITMKPTSPIEFKATQGVSSKKLEGFTPEFSVESKQLDLTVKSVKGKFNVDFGLKPETISLGDLSIDGAEDIKFALLDVIFNLVIDNPTSLPITMNLDLVPVDKDGVKQEAQRVSIPDVVLSADAVTRLQISRYAEPVISTPNGDYKGIRTNLASLFIDMPESIEVSIKPTIDPEKEYTVELQSDPYNLTVDYDVIVPLALDKEFNMKYVDTIRDFQKDLKDVVNIVTSLKIDMDIENSIPLELSLKVTPIGLDTDDDLSDKIAIDLLDRDVASSLVGLVIRAGMADNTAAITKASIGLREKVKGAMKELDGIRLEIIIKPDQSRPGSALNKEQYIQIKSIKAQIPEGVNISLDKKEEDK